MRGKVRDVYDLGDKLLIVSTDRISAFDVVLPCGIPDKGKVLTELSAFWFNKTAHMLPNHVIKVIDSDIVLNEVKNLSCPPAQLPDSLIGRSMLVAKAERIPVECVVRGYLSGSAWAEYQESGKAGHVPLPSGMKESQELPQPIFTPTTKSDTGHDRPLCDRDVEVIDELLTPDSSRFWDASQYRVGYSQPSFDKQPVRDWLLNSGWDRQSPAPVLPPDVIEATSKRYRDVYGRLTGHALGPT
jgi:phosphoribosylaminoimidazole-succinocarboxamide synthase